MKEHRVVFLVILGTVLVQGCHHIKEDFPPDTFPEEEERRKRSLTTERPGDVDKELSDFFTTCMFEKTGSVFASWRSVIDFILRDTRWYSASDEQYCPENSERDPNSVKCWQSRLDKLLRLNSKLLPKGKECIEEFMWAQEETYTIRGRGKRSLPGFTRTTPTPDVFLEPCLGISSLKYEQCVQSELVTQRNLQRYPSLRHYDGKSIKDFITDHYTSCRITSRYTRLGNIYTEQCPNQFGPKPKQCISSIYREITRTSSPLYAATTTCTNKYTKDNCLTVTCFRLRTHCDQNTGQCVCDSGYQMNSDGNCVILDQCSLVFCGGTHEICNPLTGRCQCKASYERDHRGICIAEDKCDCRGKHETCDRITRRCTCIQGYVRNHVGTCTILNACALVFCGGENEICIQSTGACDCKPGYSRDFYGFCRAINLCSRVVCRKANEVCDPNSGICVCKPQYSRDRYGRCQPKEVDPCSTKQCGANQRCFPYQGQGYCVCLPGFKWDSSGVCGPTSPDPCAGKNCGPHGQCRNSNGKGVCMCNVGYTMRGTVCRELNPCENFPCQANMECRVNRNTKAAECHCLPDFVRSRNGPGCTKKDPCDGVDCFPQSECVLGSCVCVAHFTKNADGFCIPIDPCATVRCGRYMRCVANPATGLGECQCISGYVKAKGNCIPEDPCAGVSCPPISKCVGGNCECFEGYQMNSQKLCVAKDPCAMIECGKFTECRVLGGRPKCQCIPGYVEAKQGPGCVKEDPCANLPPCPPHSSCVMGNCDCDEGYHKDAFGSCVDDDPCKFYCTTNEKCIIDQGEPRCICEEGYSLNEFGECMDSDPCDDINCDANMECRGGLCFCIRGYEKSKRLPGCVKIVIDPCRNHKCPPNSDCVAGQCSCHAGYQKNPAGLCLAKDPCAGVKCDAPYTQCKGGRCVCVPGGFVKDPEGDGCHKVEGAWSEWSEWRKCSKTCGKGGIQVRFRTCEGAEEGSSVCEGIPFESRPCNEIACGKDDPCVRVKCTSNSMCVRGNCVCDAGYNKIDNGSCISCPPGKIFNSCPTICYGRCDSLKPANASFCATVCRPGVHCVCAPGYVETSLGDSTCVKRDECSGPDVWAPWGNWVSCTQSCGIGVQLRSRACRGNGCQGGRTETRPCNTHRCGPPGQCDAGKTFVACPTKCPKTCENRYVEILCESGCRENVTCVCTGDMIERSSTDLTCVIPNECPGLCWPNPCKHDGKCIPLGAYYNCRCEEGYSGRSCQLGCGKFCAANGRCILGKCVCDTGYISDEKGGCTRDLPIPQ